jgi:hypothetical protein
LRAFDQGLGKTGFIEGKNVAIEHGWAEAKSIDFGACTMICFAAPYLIACGLMGEPVPPVMTRGGPQKKNS